jgi:hypothetical protein
MRHPIAITTSVLEDLHNDGSSQWVEVTALCDDGTIWHCAAEVGVWIQLPGIPNNPPHMAGPLNPGEMERALR